FLSAITADPADLTVRLVYADWLEDRGDPRAEFIRVQIEADGLPPSDPRRRAMEARAAELFAGSWGDWWRPVCETVGRPVPHGPEHRLRDRIAGAFMASRPVGWPYRDCETGVVPYGILSSDQSPQLRGLRGVQFARGWPEELDLAGDLSKWAGPLRRWAAASPLTGLDLLGDLHRENWAAIAGEHLRSVRRLVLFELHADAVREITASPHLPGVTDLTLVPPGLTLPHRGGGAVEQLRILVGSSMAPRLERLCVNLGNREEAAALGSADVFARLTRLVVTLTDRP